MRTLLAFITSAPQARLTGSEDGFEFVLAADRINGQRPPRFP